MASAGVEAKAGRATHLITVVATQLKFVPFIMGCINPIEQSSPNHDGDLRPFLTYALLLQLRWNESAYTVLSVSVCLGLPIQKSSPFDEEMRNTS